MSIKKILPTAVFQLYQESGGITVVDVRETDEFAEVCSPLAENFPLSTFDVKGFAKGRDLQGPIFMLCRSGKRSLQAAQMLDTAGFRSVYNIEGGMLAWEACGLPVMRRR